MWKIYCAKVHDNIRKHINYVCSSVVVFFSFSSFALLLLCVLRFTVFPLNDLDAKQRTNDRTNEKNGEDTLNWNTLTEMKQKKVCAHTHTNTTFEHSLICLLKRKSIYNCRHWCACRVFVMCGFWPFDSEKLYLSKERRCVFDANPGDSRIWW